MARKSHCPLHVLKIDDWPAIDRALWLAGTAWDPEDFRRPYAARKAEGTLRNAQKAWGLVLWVLTRRGLLNSEAKPAERMTLEVADLFLLALYAAGNANSSIKVRFWNVRSALKVMQPEIDTTWLTKPGNWSLHSLLPHTQKQRELIGTEVLYAWGLAMIGASMGQPTAKRRFLMLRNGLIIAIFASRAPRVRSMSTIRVGRQLQLSAQTCRLVFGAKDMKTPKPLNYEIPPGLAPWVRRYLEVERREALGTSDHDAMWLAEDGSPLELGGIAAMISRESKKEFGKAFATHQFRYELATALAEADPDNPGLAAAVLGDSLAVAERYYIQPRNRQAAQLVNRSTEDDRERTRLLARRSFGIDDL